MSLIVVDNFLPQPNIIRNWALNQQYYTASEFKTKYNQHTDWPGKRTENVLDLYPEYANAVYRQIASICNIFFKSSNISIKSYFQLTTMNDGDSWVHQDNNVDVSSVLYLSPNPPTNSGTSLYNCKDVIRWKSFMTSQEGYQTLKTINRYENKQLYNELFDIKDVIGNIFNRLVVYSGQEYHKSNDYFGNDINTGRLTQVFFCKFES